MEGAAVVHVAQPQPSGGRSEGRTRSRRAIAGQMVGILLFAWALRLFLLGGMSLRGDEALSVIYAQRSLPEIIRITRFVSGHPPLFYTLLHFWEGAVGTTEFATRAFAVWWGVLAVALVFKLGTVLFGVKPAVGGALLVAVNPFQVMIGQDIRSYTMLGALSLLCSYAFWCALQRAGWQAWARYALSGVFVVHCHYFGSFLILTHGVFFVYYRLRRRGPWRQGILSLAAITCSLIPWLWLARSVLKGDHGGGGRSLALGEVFRQSLITFGIGYWREQWGEALITVGLALLLGWGVWRAFRRARQEAVFATLVIIVPSLSLFALSRLRPLFEERYLVASAPMYALLLGFVAAPLEGWPKLAAWVRLQTRWLGLAFLVGLAGFALIQYYFDPAYAKSPEWREAALYLQRQQKPDDVVILNHQDQAFLYYYRGPELHVLPAPGDLDPISVGSSLQALVSQHDRVWLLPDTNRLWDREGIVQGWLDEHCELVWQTSWRGISLALYHTPRRYEDEMRPLDARLQDEVRLLGYVVRDRTGQAVDRLEVVPGESIALTLYWRADTALAEDYTVFTHLLDPTGWLRGQRDNPPRGGSLPTSAWTPGTLVVDQYRIALAADAPSGDYAIEVGMYRPDSGVRLRVAGTDGDVENRRVLLRDAVRVQ
jgi:hypothetical protein